MSAELTRYDLNIFLDGICARERGRYYLATEADAEIARLRVELAWQPIETAPKDGTVVLIWCAEGIKTAWWEACYVWVAPGAWVSDHNRSDTEEHEPTHWMRLPEPPARTQPDHATP